MHFGARLETVARNIPPCTESHLGLCLFKFCGGSHFLKGYHDFIFVWHFDTNGCLSRDRRFDTDIRNRQIQLDVVCQIGDTVDADTHFRLQLITGNRRSTGDICHLYIDAKIAECLFQFVCRGFQFCLGISVSARRLLFQK